MKFRFIGGQDCPDWVLAEMSTLSRLTSIKTRMIASKVCENLLMSLNDADLLATVTGLTADAKFETDDIRATIAALSFIFNTSGRKLSLNVLLRAGFVN